VTSKSKIRNYRKNKKCLKILSIRDVLWKWEMLKLGKMCPLNSDTGQNYFTEQKQEHG
jgi:hypothetical protein